MARYKLDAVRVLLLLFIAGGVIAGVFYARFRVERAEADIERARNTAVAVLQIKEAIDQERDVLAVLGSLGGDVVEGAAQAAFSIYRSDAGTFDEAATDARHCEAEATRSRGWLSLLRYEQPTECRSMFKLLGEAPELADAGVTFGNAVAKEVAGGKRPKADPAAPGCSKWEIVRVSFTAPRTKKGFRNPPWDVGLNTNPDVYIKLRVGLGSERRSPTSKNRFEVAWDVDPPVEVTPGQKIEITALDKDAASDDHIVGYSVVWEQAAYAREVDLSEFKLGVRCAS